MSEQINATYFEKASPVVPFRNNGDVYLMVPSPEETAAAADPSDGKENSWNYILFLGLEKKFDLF